MTLWLPNLGGHACNLDLSALHISNFAAFFTGGVSFFGFKK